MAEQDQGKTTPETEQTQQQATEQAEKASPDLKYSDRDVDRLKGQARKEARERAQREFEEARSERLRRWGVESEDDLDAIVEAHNTAKAELETEADREREAKQRAETRLAEAESARDEAYELVATLKEDAALREAFLAADAQPKKLKALLRLADRDNLDVDDAGNLTGVAEEVQRVKAEEAAEFFQPDEPERPKRIGAGSSPGPQNGSESLRGFDKVAGFLGQKYGG